ncbi:pollen-specific leucine-rich repeat extensin-like protein 3 [Penaeus chinensis]|uniref:pollen-specific leucine-rich repeat extensin-like protein 3 n=1 Tax=Penaeus chinensis TaxID=139456 RepID=UPI001FB6F91A|nr:pollen-specific leucine-rich repeat extensin-like protein 3 [Penaeus chinensis]
MPVNSAMENEHLRTEDHLRCPSALGARDTAAADTPSSDIYCDQCMINQNDVQNNLLHILQYYTQVKEAIFAINSITKASAPYHHKPQNMKSHQSSHPFRHSSHHTYTFTSPPQILNFSSSSVKHQVTVLSPPPVIQAPPTVTPAPPPVIPAPPPVTPAPPPVTQPPTPVHNQSRPCHTSPAPCHTSPELFTQAPPCHYQPRPLSHQPHAILNISPVFSSSLVHLSWASPLLPVQYKVPPLSTAPPPVIPATTLSHPGPPLSHQPRPSQQQDIRSDGS